MLVHPYLHMCIQKSEADISTKYEILFTIQFNSSETHKTVIL